MKRLFCFAILFALFFCSASADTDISYYYGTWFHAMELNDNYFSYTLFHLFQDGTCYYTSRIIEDGKIDDDFGQLFSWESVDDGIRIHFANGFRQFTLTEDGRLTDGQEFAPYVFKKIFPAEYVRRSDAPRIIPGNLQGGLLLDPGQYIIGTDLPAGDYRFEYYEAPVDIFVHKDPESAMWSAFASVTKNSTVFAKLNLPEGARLDIGAFPVIIMYAKPLNIGE